MQHGYQRALNIIGLVVAAGLNVAVVSFYVLWFIADSDAINRMETATSVDPTVLLPNATLLWLAANASLVALLALDGGIVAMTMAARSRRRLAGQDPDTAEELSTPISSRPG